MPFVDAVVYGVFKIHPACLPLGFDSKLSVQKLMIASNRPSLKRPSKLKSSLSDGRKYSGIISIVVYLFFINKTHIIKYILLVHKHMSIKQFCYGPAERWGLDHLGGPKDHQMGTLHLI